ncbi:hypothetical protein EMIHUDRAFT_449788 [Emiliania huxleyi CCMP1516]|uniref:Uncharacterized protein n=2 Tax=Emiliania huxleyi TaxID=2903 RepID=A0A0D3K319_EMIH1|nr:hypothetical protein EMIHUDRAFT_449788 [Emiliania huxleyi CCMP1516]EOD30154.1 hypothetical protein EMIHUDRAFT_449788 [Emiliania huxleyi CCMP1516]|eukprot:XP_005782583.1 hypothetical protein EMIHUDRAFT_449788 [Emiliania huxleyi CCMP1516]
MTLRARSRRLAAPPEPSFAPVSVDPHGTLSLANTVFSNCTAQTGASAVFVSAEAHLRTAMLSLELPCLAGVPPAIHADRGADLSIRALSVSQPDNCRRAPAELAASAVSGAAATLGAGVSLVGGEQPGAGEAPASLCSAGTCATDAACTADYEAMADALMVTARCSCEPPNLPSPEAASAELAPYEGGCLTPREGVTVSVPQAVAENVVIELSKTSRPETANRTIVLHMGGSSSAEARWTVDEGALPPWLSVWPTSGVLPAGVDKAALFTVSASSAHVAEQSEPYTAAINLTVSSQRTKLFRVPVLVIVAVTTSAKHSMWGEARPTEEGSFECERADAPPPVELEVGEEREVVFTACDSEGLRVAHSLPSLRSEAVAAAGPKAFHVELHDREGLRAARPAEMLYAYVSLGRYKATVASPLVGDLDLLLYVDGALVDSRHVVARCPPYLVPLPDRSCGCDTNLEPVGGLAESQGCRPCYMGYHKGAPGNGSCQPDTWPIIVSSVGGALGLVMILVLVIFARRIYQRHLLAMAAAEREGAEKRRRIQEAVKGVTSLKFPLSVMPLSKLREQGRLMPYEEARDAGVLRCCDTMEAAVSFAADHPLVFVSHQWLSASHPDPHSQHYPIILEAAEALCAEHGLDPSKLHLWLDYHSIPQANEATKWLAIGSIALYAACSHFFVVAAPHALHVDSSPPRRVDAETYLRRGWCRLEQWAFIAINGTQQMYVYETSLARIAERRRWIEESVNVFQGDFTLESDKAHLVDVVLGLYGLAVVAAIELRYRSVRATSVSSSGGEARVTAVGSRATRTSQEVSSRQLTELITERRDFIFPPEHFGDLVDRLEEELENAALERFGSEAGVRTPSPVRASGDGPRRASHCAASQATRYAASPPRRVSFVDPPPPTGGRRSCGAAPPPVQVPPPPRRFSLGFAGLAGLPPLQGMSGKPQERRSSGTARQLAPMAPVSERRSLSRPSHARSQSGTGWRCPPATGGTVAEGDDRSSRRSSTAMDVVTT